MKNRARIILIVLLSIAVVTSWKYYSNRSLESAKAKIIINLEGYKEAHSVYPNDLQVLNTDVPDNISYYPDSAKQSFTLAYSTGFMNCNTVRYSSQTKKWEEISNY